MNKQEQRILTALCNNLASVGYTLACIRSDFDDTDELAVTTVPALVEIFEKWDMFAPTVVFTDWQGERQGVMVVEGNLCDFISDWNCGDTRFDAVVDGVANAANGGAFE